MIGIYKITNPFNQIYIGQSVVIERRLISHKSGNNSNFHLMLSIKKHGVKNHIFEVLEECDKDCLLERESYYLSLYKEKNLLFNYSIYLFNNDYFDLINIHNYGMDKLNSIRNEKLKDQQLILEMEIKSVAIRKEIKTLYGQLKDKKAFCTELSKEVETSPLSIYNHWFGLFWAIPEKHQDMVLEKLKEKHAL